jgi:hypothetical protein
MPKDWKEISNDELLNFDGSQTAIMARYERIMQQRSTDAVIGLRDKVTGLMETIYRASQGIQEKTDKLSELYNRISVSQSRQQAVVIGLTVVLAISTALYTWITWQSVAAMREGNEIQRQLLYLQKANSGTQTMPSSTVERETRKSGARPSP